MLQVVDAQGAGLTHRAFTLDGDSGVIIQGQRFGVVTGKVDSKAGSPAKRTVVGAPRGPVGAGVGLPTERLLTGKLTGKGVEIAPETRFTYSYTLTQPPVIVAEQGTR